MADNYYKPCRELELCNELIEKYWKTKQYEKCFEGHLALAQQGYALAECQVGFFYLEGFGVEKDMEKATYWYKQAALQNHKAAVDKCRELKMPLILTKSQEFC